tara:strand:- start:5892 stop:6587 length:696 start_codon:yes stop_codon:yes gene_type:complete
MNIIAVVPARSGSKGLPNKNIAIVNDMTLIEIAINVGLNCNLITDVYISTDSNEYTDIAERAGAKSKGLRKSYLSDDNAKSVDVVIDLLESLDESYEYLVLLQPTSPIREPGDIEKMLNKIIINHADACVSVSQLIEPHPYKLKLISEEGFLEPFMVEGSEVPRQSLPPVYALNGAIYVIKVETLLRDKTFFPPKTLPYLMNDNINIDSEEDLIFLKAMTKSDKIKIWDKN